ncbi:MAG TPA: hypothetical protein VHL98_19695 [Microvirga sp.]|jgi:hypothetical protein|nr:hypothetical protein [Microvirga sp.]
MPVPVLVAAYFTSGASNLEMSRKPNGGISTYKKGLYCGPGWGFTIQDLLDGKIKEMPKAIDAIDEACRLHDTCYQEHGYFTQGCNLVLTVDLVKVVFSNSSTPNQRVDAAIMAAIFLVESQTIDLGKMAKQEYDRMRDRMIGYLGESTHTLEQAINREMMLRTASPFGR